MSSASIVMMLILTQRSSRLAQVPQFRTSPIHKHLKLTRIQNKSNKVGKFERWIKNKKQSNDYCSGRHKACLEVCCSTCIWLLKETLGRCRIRGWCMASCNDTCCLYAWDRKPLNCCPLDYCYSHVLEKPTFCADPQISHIILTPISALTHLISLWPCQPLIWAILFISPKLVHRNTKQWYKALFWFVRSVLFCK